MIYIKHYLDIHACLLTIITSSKSVIIFSCCGNNDVDDSTKKNVWSAMRIDFSYFTHEYNCMALVVGVVNIISRKCLREYTQQPIHLIIIFLNNITYFITAYLHSCLLPYNCDNRVLLLLQQIVIVVYNRLLAV